MNIIAVTLYIRCIESGKDHHSETSSQRDHTGSLSLSTVIQCILVATFSMASFFSSTPTSMFDISGVAPLEATTPLLKRKKENGPEELLKPFTLKKRKTTQPATTANDDVQDMLSGLIGEFDTPLKEEVLVEAVPKVEKNKKKRGSRIIRKLSNTKTATLHALGPNVRITIEEYAPGEKKEVPINTLMLDNVELNRLCEGIPKLIEGFQAVMSLKDTIDIRTWLSVGFRATVKSPYWLVNFTQWKDRKIVQNMRLKLLELKNLQNLLVDDLSKFMPGVAFTDFKRL